MGQEERFQITPLFWKLSKVPFFKAFFLVQGIKRTLVLLIEPPSKSGVLCNFSIFRFFRQKQTNGSPQGDGKRSRWAPGHHVPLHWDRSDRCNMSLSSKGFSFVGGRWSSWKSSFLKSVYGGKES